jgi:hypothetical protein
LKGEKAVRLDLSGLAALLWPLHSHFGWCL